MRVRRPVVALASWSTGLTTLAAPWLLTPPLEARLTAGVLAGLTVWTAFRLAGWVVAAFRSRARAGVLGLTLVLLLSGCTPASDPGAASGSVQVAGGTTGPLRVHVGLGAAPTDSSRAQLAVSALVQAGGLSRSVLLVAVPTGSGWLDEGAVRSLERLTGGDVATVDAQYAQHPSWVEYLRGPERANRSATAVLGAVRAQLAGLPADRRPRLLVFGESLGATAVATAVRVGGAVDGCLLAGRPASLGDAGVPGCTDVRNDDDPVPIWSPRLLVRPRGGQPWLPVVSFWQATGAMVGSLSHGPGHGHSYGAELSDDWARLLPGTPRQPRVGVPAGAAPATSSASSSASGTAQP